MVEEAATERRLYLPAGGWYNLWTGEALTGEGWMSVATPLEHIPVFVRAGAILPLQLGPGQQLGDDVGSDVEPTHLTLFVYPPGASETTVVLGGNTYQLTVGADAVVALPELPISATIRLPNGDVALSRWTGT